MQAIPTKFRGVNFRSRLEARWAAFFDLLGWEWLYEPIDLDNYIPDFILKMRKDVLVEVKPYTRLTDPVLATAWEKIMSSGWDASSFGEWGVADSLIVGACLHQGESSISTVVGVLGVSDAFGTKKVKYPSDEVDLASIGLCSGCHRWSFSSTQIDYGCRLCGDNQGGCPVGTLQTFRERDWIHELWATAGNHVQWRGVDL